MTAIETEVKFRVRDALTLERSLQAAGFHQETARTFERNILYDTPERRLRLERQILRIRQYGDKWVLTHKALPAEGDTGLYKHRVETETTLGDGETVAAIFAALGFIPAFTYEKWRTEWADGNGHCVIDETPLGTYAEIEGPEDWINRTAAALGVDPTEFIGLSYGRLFEVWKAETGSPATDLTFAAVLASAEADARR
jgi:adenylate cyclase, class 2